MSDRRSAQGKINAAGQTAPALNPRARLHFLFLNIGHFLDHLFTLIFATVAALVLSREWGLSYAELIPYATPGFVAFGLFSLPSGWLADRWSREGMIAVFFIGIGIAAIATSFASSPMEIAIGLFVVGVFAAIYHPVGLALVAEEQRGLGMAIAINGVWGNLGVGSAALITGFLIDVASWHAAFAVPGAVSIAIGLAYLALFHQRIRLRARRTEKAAGPGGRVEAKAIDPAVRALLIRLTILVFFTAAVGSLIFQSTTFALPKVFEERLGGIAGSATIIGALAFLVFAVGSLAQLVVGASLDRFGPRTIFAVVVTIQLVFFAAMPGLVDWAALVVALAFMIGAFGQIPINDYLIGRTAKSELRASVYGARYVVTFTVLAATLPFISWVHANHGFDTLFRVLAGASVALLAAVWLLPNRLPGTEPANPTVKP
ncbi:MAG: MFS transporter [Hyphomicrobiaceae bacterium]